MHEGSDRIYLYPRFIGNINRVEITECQGIRRNDENFSLSCAIKLTSRNNFDTLKQYEVQRRSDDEHKKNFAFEFNSRNGAKPTSGGKIPR